MFYWKPSGNYTVVTVDSQDRNNQAVALLQKLWTALQPVIQDLQATNTDGTPKPSAAYKTFFKDPKNMPFVLDIFTKITRGDSMISNDDKYHFSHNGSPVFFSLTDFGQLLATDRSFDAFSGCANPVDTAGWNEGSPWIRLCPSFWTGQSPIMYGDVPPPSVNGAPASNCLRVNRAGTRFSLTDHYHIGYDLIQYRMWVMMEELVHYYVKLSSGRGAEDTGSANRVFRLSAEDSLYSAQAYMFYAASEFPYYSSIALLDFSIDIGSFSIGVYGNCKDFPSRPRGQELLEVQIPDDPSEPEVPGAPGTVDFNATIDTSVFNDTNTMNQDLNVTSARYYT